jgi:arsenate reductase-like glutaredoxin family protein
MKKIFHLANCNTCQRIIKELDEGNGFELQNIKEEKITPDQIETMHKMAGSYEALFSRRAMKYRSMGLNEMELTEKDYRKYILEEYTFLKRPVIIVNDEIFIGNSKKVVAAAKEKINL